MEPSRSEHLIEVTEAPVDGCDPADFGLEEFEEGAVLYVASAPDHSELTWSSVTSADSAAAGLRMLLGEVVTDPPAPRPGLDPDQDVIPGLVE